MRDRVALWKTNNGSQGAVTVFGYVFNGYQSNTVISSEERTDATHVFTQENVQLLERGATTFKIRIRRSVIDFSHVAIRAAGDDSVGISSRSTNEHSPFFEIVGFRYLGGGSLGDSPKANPSVDDLAAQGFIELECKFDPLINLKYARLDGIQTAVRGGDADVIETPYETQRGLTMLNLDSMNLMRSENYLMIRVVSKFSKMKNQAGDAFISGDSRYGYTNNDTIGKILAYSMYTRFYPKFLSELLEDLDTAFTVVDAWITPYIPITTRTINYGGFTLLDCDMSSSGSANVKRFYEYTIPRDKLTTSINSWWHKGRVGLVYGENEESIPLKEVVGVNTAITDLKLHAVFTPTVSSQTPNKLMLIERRGGGKHRLLLSIDIPVHPFPLIDSARQRYEKETHYEQRVEIAEAWLSLLTGILANPKLGMGLVDAILNFITAGAYEVAKNADMDAQPVTLTNDAGVITVSGDSLDDMAISLDYPITEWSSANYPSTRSPEAVLNRKRALEVDAPTLRKLSNVKFNDEAFRCISNANYYYVKGDFTVRIDATSSAGIDSNASYNMFNIVMAKEMADLLKQGVMFS